MADTDTPPADAEEVSEPTESVGEGTDRVDFHDNGTVILVMAGTRYRIRRPTIGEAQHLEDLLEERTIVATKAQRRLMDRLAEIGISLNAQGGVEISEVEGLDEVEALERMRDVKRESREATLEGSINWWREVLITLADARPEDLPPTDQWPTFMTAAALMSRVNQHWLLVPWGLGGTTRPAPRLPEAPPAKGA